MALTPAQIREVGSLMVRADPALGNVFKRADLDAAVIAADGWVETMLTAQDAAMPKLWRDNATADQKAKLRAYVWMTRAGVG